MLCFWLARICRHYLQKIRNGCFIQRTSSPFHSERLIANEGIQKRLWGLALNVSIKQKHVSDCSPWRVGHVSNVSLDLCSYRSSYLQRNLKSIFISSMSADAAVIKVLVQFVLYECTLNPCNILWKKDFSSSIWRSMHFLPLFVNNLIYNCIVLHTLHTACYILHCSHHL